ncbi:MAG: hypothetical protein ACM31C_23675 [Acidobacteriota bacterium]
MRSIWSILVPCSLLAACAVDPLTSTTDQNATGNNALAANALAANALAANALAANALAPNALAANALAANALAANALLTDASGRSVYSYIVSCALPADVVVIADVPGVSDTPVGSPFTCSAATQQCTFPGGLGLAPYWADRRLDAEGQQWISSCLFARVSAFGTPDEISLRGRNPALAVSDAELELYTTQEGAFYGNWFAKTAWVPGDALACSGEGQLGGVTGGLVKRACARPDPANPGYTLCGFTYTGWCADYTPQAPTPHACNNFRSAGGGYYDECHGKPNGTANRLNTRAWTAAITTYVP